jgi:hypothetical protein
MTRSELILLLAERFPQLVQKDAEMAAAEILGAIHAALVNRIAAQNRRLKTLRSPVGQHYGLTQFTTQL